MFVRTTISKIFEFTDDDIFWRGDNHKLVSQTNTSCVPKRPRMQIVSASEIEVSFKASIEVNDVKMSRRSR
jgi:hypothetical protein